MKQSCLGRCVVVMAMLVRNSYAVGLFILATALSAQAAEVFPQEEANRFLKAHQTITHMGPTPFGEQVNLYTGELSFSQTDITLTGRGPDIVIARTTRTSQDQSPNIGGGEVSAAFGSWDLAIPRIETMVMTPSPTILGTVGENWKADSSGPNTYARCSINPKPWNAYENWWRGIELIAEDGSRHSIMNRVPENAQAPGGQTGTYPLLTESNWQISCLPSTANGEPGEGFLAVRPDGTRYYFNYLNGIRTDTVKEINYVPPPDPRRIESTELANANEGEGSIRVPSDGQTYDKTGRMLARMYVTRIEDRFNNWVEYQYQNNRISAITASDGRSVSVAWRTDAPLIETIRTQPGTSSEKAWGYGYAGFDLTSVTLPDTSQWLFSGALAVSGSPQDALSGECYVRSGLANQAVRTVSVTAPSGLVGTFTTTGLFHGRSYVPSVCGQEGAMAPFREGNFPLFGTFSLTSREFSGPGLAPLTWGYVYSPGVGSTTSDPCASAGTCAETATVEVSNPDGTRTRHLFSNRWGISDGRVIDIETLDSNLNVVRTESRKYSLFNAGPYPTRLGELVAAGDQTNVDKIERMSPLKEVTLKQNGRIFSSNTTVFDAYGRASTILKSSAPGP